MSSISDINVKCQLQYQMIFQRPLVSKSLTTLLKTRYNFWNKRTPPPKQQINPVDPKSTQSAAISPVGLNMFINRVYVTTGLAFLTGFGTSFIASSVPYFVVNPFMCITAGSVMGIIGLAGAHYTKPTEAHEQFGGITILKTRNNLLRLSCYVTGCMGLGLGFLPFLIMTASLSPQLIANLLALTIGTFGGASLLVYGLPKIPLFQYGGLFGAAVGGLAVMKINHYMNEMIYGENFMSYLIEKADTYVGILVFFCFIVYNTQLAIKSYKLNKADHLGITLQFIFDFLNLLKRILIYLFGRKK